MKFYIKNFFSKCDQIRSFLCSDLKYYNGKNNIFFGKKVLRENVNCVCVPLTVLVKLKKNYYVQIFVEQWQHKEKLKEIVSFIPKDIGSSSSDDDNSDD